MRKFLLITAITMVAIASGAIVISLVALNNDQEGMLDVAEAVPEEEEDINNEDVISETLVIAAATGTVDSGLLEMLSLEFYTDTGITLELIPADTSEALAYAESGEVDLLFVHARAKEEQFVEAGNGVELVPVMYNDFVVIGPGDMVEMTEEVGLLFTLIEVLELPFVSRGDDSGIHQMEMYIWESFELDPTVNPYYVEAEQGMDSAILMADEMNAFTLTDRGSWLRQSHIGGMENELIIICEGDPMLHNQYGVIAVNPEMHPGVNIQGANVFIEWITSQRIQELIGQFGVTEFGEALYTPNAG